MSSLAVSFVTLVVALISQTPEGAGGPASAPVLEPKAVEVVRRYVEVTGGREAYERVKTREMTATLSFPSLKLTGKTVTEAKAPDKVVSVQELTGRPTTTTGYDGETGWTRTGDKPARKLQGVELKQAKAQAGFNAALNVERLYTTIRIAPPLPGDGLIDGKAVDRVELANESESIVQSYDHATGLLVQSEQTAMGRGGKPQPVVTRYEDYREVDGIKYPHTIRTAVGQIVLEEKITEIKHNMELADSLFAMPVAGAETK